jgi:spore germination protein YaaH
MLINRKRTRQPSTVSVITPLIRRIQVTWTRLAISLVAGCTTAIAMCVLGLVLVAGLAIPEVPSSGAVSRPTTTAGNAQLPFPEHEIPSKSPVLPAATVPPEAAPTSVAAAAPLSPHEVFGFVPYWSLDQSPAFSVAGLTTLDYFSVGINANGTLDESGAGWNGYESQALSNLITRAHGAGIRVVLTVNDFDQHSLDALTSGPTAATTLAGALITAIRVKNLDGVNLDLEGSGNADQAGLTRLVTTVSDALHQVDPHWQVTMDTYASSAGDPGGFYDVAALATAVDGLFVMEYSPNVAASAQANSPLTSSLFSDLTTVQQYAAAVPADKVILGMPLYGEDWPTTDNTLSATATGPVTTLTDDQIGKAGHPTYWDSITESAWTAYQVGNQWHETFFDDPTSLYQIGLLASHYGLGGVGMWALGTDGTDPTMVSALSGTPPPIQYSIPPTPSTTATTPSSTALPAPSASAITPPAGASGGAPGIPATAIAGSGATGGKSTVLPPSFTGTFEAASLATVEGDSPASPSSPVGLQSVTLCLVPPSPIKSTACGAPDPASPEPVTSTTVAPEPAPPFPGASVVGVLSGITVTNDAALSCLETDDQLTELGPSPVDATPELVVWQVLNDLQFYYVVMTTTPTGSAPADCTNATLAFPITPQASPT